MGFFAQPHDRGGYLQLSYDEFFAQYMVRRYEIALLPIYRWNWNGVPTQAQLEAAFRTDFVNFWHMDLVYDYKMPSYDDEERGIIGTYRKPVAHAFQLVLTSDPRKDVTGTLTTGYEWNRKGKRDLTELLSLTVRPAAWAELEPMVFYERTRHDEAGVLSGGAIVALPYAGLDRSLYADRDVDEVDVALRGIVTFTRQLSLQFYLQELLAKGRYLNERLLVGSSEFVAQSNPSPGYDFNEIVFNANVLLRWEFLPGSALYLVWTQGRFDYPVPADYSVGFSTRFNDTFRLPHQDVVLLKVSYWIPF